MATSSAAPLFDQGLCSWEAPHSGSQPLVFLLLFGLNPRIISLRRLSMSLNKILGPEGESPGARPQQPPHP